MAHSKSDPARSRRSTLKKSKLQEKLHQEYHLMALDEAGEEDQHEKDTIEYFRSVFQTQKEASTVTAPKGFYQQMHIWSKIGTSRFSSFHIGAVRSSTSTISISNFSTKFAPNSYLATLKERNIDPPFIPAHLGTDRTWHDRYATEVRKYANRLQTGTHLDTGAARVITIVKHKSRMMFLPRTLNYSMAPITAVKVQWRVSRFLRVPSFLLIYSMLSRYGTAVALIKLSSNSALCIYDTLQQAQLAISMNSLNQSYKVLILSWWYQDVVRYLPSSAMCSKVGTSWLLAVCDDVFGTNLNTPNKWSYNFADSPFDDFNEDEPSRKSILPMSKKSIQLPSKSPGTRQSSCFPEVLQKCLPLDQWARSKDGSLLPELKASTRNASFVPQLEARTRNTSLLPKLKARTRNASSVPELQAKTKDTSSVPELEARTKDASSVPELATRTRNTSLLPKLKAGTRDASLVPELEMRTKDASSVPELATRTRNTSLLPKMKAGTRDASLVPELEAKTREDRSIPM